MKSTRLRASASLLGFAALLCGCTVGPDFLVPEAPKETGYRAEGEAATVGEQHLDLGKQIAGDWWSLYHSEELSEVVRQAIAGNRTLAAAEAALAQAQEAVAQATGGLYPQLDLNGSATRLRNPPQALGLQRLPPGFPAIFNLFSIGPRVSYLLDIFGGTRRGIEQASALAEAADHEVDAAYLSLTGNAVNQALAVASINAQIRTVQGIIAEDETNLRLVNDEVNAGVATQLDIETARSQLAADRTLLPPLRQQSSVARHALAILIGKPPVDWTPPKFDLADFTLPNNLPVSLPSTLVRQRPDILTAEAQLHAASAAIGVATAQLYPSITLSAGTNQEATTVSQLFWGSSNAWSMAAGLTAPIFHGGELEAQRSAAVDAYDAAMAKYQETVLDAFDQVADVLDALQHDAELIDEEHRALEAAEASLRLTRTTYSIGNVGILQVVDAQRLVEQARLGFVRAQAQRLVDTAQLFLAMGGGWWDWQAHNPGAAATQTAPQPVSVPAPPK
ncbi:MAG TPA: efflux transporter outer membrane subunit [Stellaceae bacterium]|nr:efflux transporter outer membrane subunit [Stellaceae bacterium]